MNPQTVDPLGVKKLLFSLVKRYKFDYRNDAYVHENGEWVKYEDIKHLIEDSAVLTSPNTPKGEIV